MGNFIRFLSSISYHILETSWDEEFNAHESHILSSSPLLTEEPAQRESSQHPAHDGDELARTAALVLENVKHETNPKFQNSQFLGLMKQLRDGKIVVEGNQMVESGGRAKGKGRAIDLGPQQQSERGNIEENANDSYFRQENIDFIHYWNETQVNRSQSSTAETLSWDKLQADWDKFEATATGIKAITHYKFQEDNPYLLGDSAATRQHLTHTYGRQSVFEVRPFSLPHIDAAHFRHVRVFLSWRLQFNETWKVRLLGLN